MIKQKDLQIICSLRQNSRMPLTKISRITQIPVSTIYDKLQKSEAIVRNTVLLDFSKLGYGARGNVLLKVGKEDKQQLHEFLCRNASVNSVYRVNNGYDFMVEGVFRQLKDMEEFLDALKARFSVEDEKTFFIIDEVQREKFLTDEVTAKWI